MLSLSSCSPPLRGYGGGITAGGSNGRDCLGGKVKTQCCHSLPPAASWAVGFSCDPAAIAFQRLSAPRTRTNDRVQ